MKKKTIFYVIAERPNKLIYAGHDERKAEDLLNYALTHNENAYRMESDGSDHEDLIKKYKVDDFSLNEIPISK